MKEKALCANILRVLIRIPQQRPGGRQPFRLKKHMPQVGNCKGKIHNHDSKAKWLLKGGKGEIPRKKTKHTVVTKTEE